MLTQFDGRGAANLHAGESLGGVRPSERVLLDTKVSPDRLSVDPRASANCAVSTSSGSRSMTSTSSDRSLDSSWATTRRTSLVTCTANAEPPPPQTYHVERSTSLLNQGTRGQTTQRLMSQRVKNLARRPTGRGRSSLRANHRRRSASGLGPHRCGLAFSIRPYRRATSAT